MPSIRTVLLAVHAVSFAALFGVSFIPRYALGSPAAMPFPWMATDRFHSVSAAESQARKAAIKTSPTPAAARSRSHQPEAYTAAGRNLSDYSPRGVYVRRSSDVDPCTQMSSQAASITGFGNSYIASNGSDADPRQIHDLTTTFYQTSRSCWETVIQPAYSDKGLGYYDPNVPLETTLKEWTNYSKDVTASLYALAVYDLPLCSSLGPILYDIKCLIDDTLDLTEDLTDFILDILNPLLAPLDAQLEELLALLGLS